MVDSVSNTSSPTSLPQASGDQMQQFAQSMNDELAQSFAQQLLFMRQNRQMDDLKQMGKLHSQAAQISSQ